MTRVADFLFEVKMLKDLSRAGYSFLGAGRESVAEHSFMTAMIAFVMSRIEPGVDSAKLLAMALVHDLPEARTGDLNYVHKNYVTLHEDKAVKDLSQGLPFGGELVDLINEFNQEKTLEAKLARDADQLSFILELKHLKDTGAKSPENWLPVVLNRLITDTGRKIAESIMSSEWDDWWRRDYKE